jgi:acyl dehydratase
MTYERTVSAAESVQFAALSGDRNPIHSDPVAARRLPYRTMIVHGVHTLCISLDTWCRQQAEHVTLTSLIADFRKPVFFGNTVEVSFTSEGNKITVRARADGNLVMKAQCTCVDSVRLPATTLAGRPPVESAATWNRTQLTNAKGAVAVMADPAIASKLFPDFIRVLGLDILALLLATSRVVGMKCPGTNSLFTSLQLTFDRNCITADILTYHANGIDARFDILDVNLSTDGVTGIAQSHLLQAPE